MLRNIVRKDLQKKKSISIVLFLFIMLSAFLISSGSSMMTKLVYSLEYLFNEADAPHFVQMHAGEINLRELEQWAASQPVVKKHQTVEMLTIDGGNIVIGNRNESEAGSVMDISLVKQNNAFDFLLDLDNQVIQLSNGEIGIPIYYMKRDGLRIGDTVVITTGAIEKQFTVRHFVRDALMNPSIVHSKRFLVSYGDYDWLKQNMGELEYLIEFQLHDKTQLNNFSQSYQSANLPSLGPAIDYNMFKVLNALTEGIVALIIIVVSILLIVIALLCLRLTILASIEEDYKEIGVMKAIGISHAFIKRMYEQKYIFISATASIVGYVLFLLIRPFITEKMLVYIGVAPMNILEFIIPWLAITLLFLTVLVFCSLAVRRFRRFSAVEALRGEGSGVIKRSYFPSIQTNKFLHVNLLLGLKDVTGRFKLYVLLLFVFIVCAFLIIVPVNFFQTIQSPSFITYMGIGKSDIRIDLPQSPTIVQRFDEALTYLESDNDVEQFTTFVTSQYKVIGSDGLLKTITIETGDMSVFPLEYIDGKVPTKENEIALSYLNSQELEKRPGDTLHIIVDEQVKDMVVSGIYQDITNGGRTAKALLPVNHDNALWYVISLDVKPHVNISEKTKEYSQAFYPAKVTDIEGYLAETLGDTIKQIRALTIIAISIALAIAMLITALFVKLLVAKDEHSIVILKSIGFSLIDIQVQYVTRILVVFGTAMVIGTILANTLGQELVGVVWSFMGAANIEFMIKPIFAYILCPLILVASVTVTTILSTASIGEKNIADMNAE